MNGRLHGRLGMSVAMMAGALVAFGGCAFVESAAEVTVGAPDVPQVETEARLTVERVNAALRAGFDENSPDLPEVIYESALLHDGASWEDVRLVLCDAVKLGLLPLPRIDVVLEDGEASSSTENVKAAVLRLEIPVPNREMIECYRNPLRAVALVDFVPFTSEQAKQVEEQLKGKATIDEVLVQIRFQFDRLAFERVEGGDVVTANGALQNFESVITDPLLSDDPETPFDEARFQLVPFFLLDSIGEETPQRFELDPDSPVTSSMRQAIAETTGSGPDARPLRIELVAELRATELPRTRVNGSGIVVRFQPEIVISVLQLAL